ncbi:hypothetical protein HDU76_003324, partial [Blyttiomyces sp. JEL0837]
APKEKIPSLDTICGDVANSNRPSVATNNRPLRSSVSFSNGTASYDSDLHDPHDHPRDSFATVAATSRSNSNFDINQAQKRSDQHTPRWNIAKVEDVNGSLPRQDSDEANEKGWPSLRRSLATAPVRHRFAVSTGKRSVSTPVVFPGTDGGSVGIDSDGAVTESAGVVRGICDLRDGAGDSHVEGVLGREGDVKDGCKEEASENEAGNIAVEAVTGDEAAVVEERVGDNEAAKVEHHETGGSEDNLVNEAEVVVEEVGGLDEIVNDTNGGSASGSEREFVARESVASLQESAGEGSPAAENIGDGEEMGAVPLAPDVVEALHNDRVEDRVGENDSVESSNGMDEAVVQAEIEEGEKAIVRASVPNLEMMMAAWLSNLSTTTLNKTENRGEIAVLNALDGGRETTTTSRTHETFTYTVDPPTLSVTFSDDMDRNTATATLPKSNFASAIGSAHLVVHKQSDDVLAAEVFAHVNKQNKALAEQVTPEMKESWPSPRTSSASSGVKPRFSRGRQESEPINPYANLLPLLHEQGNEVVQTVDKKEEDTDSLITNYAARMAAMEARLAASEARVNQLATETQELKAAADKQERIFSKLKETRNLEAKISAILGFKVKELEARNDELQARLEQQNVWVVDTAPPAVSSLSPLVLKNDVSPVNASTDTNISSVNNRTSNLPVLPSKEVQPSLHMSKTPSGTTVPTSKRLFGAGANLNKWKNHTGRYQTGKPGVLAQQVIDPTVGTVKVESRAKSGFKYSHVNAFSENISSHNEVASGTSSSNTVNSGRPTSTTAWGYKGKETISSKTPGPAPPMAQRESWPSPKTSRAMAPSKPHFQGRSVVTRRVEARTEAISDGSVTAHDQSAPQSATAEANVGSDSRLVGRSRLNRTKASNEIEVSLLPLLNEYPEVSCSGTARSDRTTSFTRKVTLGDHAFWAAHSSKAMPSQKSSTKAEETSLDNVDLLPLLSEFTDIVTTVVDPARKALVLYQSLEAMCRVIAARQASCSTITLSKPIKTTRKPTIFVISDKIRSKRILAVPIPRGLLGSNFEAALADGDPAKTALVVYQPMAVMCRRISARRAFTRTFLAEIAKWVSAQRSLCSSTSQSTLFADMGLVPLLSDFAPVVANGNLALVLYQSMESMGLRVAARNSSGMSTSKSAICDMTGGRELGKEVLIVSVGSAHGNAKMDEEVSTAEEADKNNTSSVAEPDYEGSEEGDLGASAEMPLRKMRSTLVPAVERARNSIAELLAEIVALETANERLQREILNAKKIGENEARVSAYQGRVICNLEREYAKYAGEDPARIAAETSV